VSEAGRCVYVVVSAAPPVLNIAEFIGLLHDLRRQVCLIATPTAASWMDLDQVGASTGCLVRTRPRLPREADSLPEADAVVVAPATFNTINKWAAGINDTTALGVLNELLGVGVPITVVPCVKALLRKHPAYAGSVERLSDAGAVFLDPDTVTFRGDDGLAAFDWPEVLRLSMPSPP
jgi:hypothetical protein